MANRSILGAAALCLLWWTGPASALPSFAQQTDLPCSSCHTVAFGPQLTPLGQKFKLDGYNVGGDKHDFVPIAAMVITSFTHTQVGQEGGAAPHFAPNDNAAVDQTSLFFAGRITDHLGAFAQATYDGIERHLAWDNVDIRYARPVSIGGRVLTWGLTLNNSPTVQDVWNTAPAWSFPYVSSALAPAPDSSVMLEEALAQQVYGLGAYTMLDDLLYLEIAGYKSLPANLQSDLGVHPDGEDRLRGVSPYWRAELKHQVGGNYLSAGVLGMQSRIFPGGDESSGTDRKTDFGYDATYIGERGKHLFEAQATVIQEIQRLPASHALQLSDVDADHLQTRRINAEYVYDHTYAATAARFDVSGSSTSRGYIAELSWTPFGKANSLWRPWLNLRTGVQYTWYTRLNDNARNNDSLFLFLWLAI